MLLDWELAMKMVNVHGVIHVGAHFAEERPFYLQHGLKVVWIEADPVTAEWLRENVPEPVYECALWSETGERELYVASNRRMSSSLLRPKDHLNKYPGITFPETVTVKMDTLDALVAREGLERYDMLWADVQGAELEVLRGGEETLKEMKALVLEINFEELYEGCALASDIDAWLGERGFGRVLMSKTGKGWGDALYVRQRAV